MKPSADCLALIRAFEGFSAVPYRCPAGCLTIGYGHVLASDCEPIGRSEAEIYLVKDANRAAAAVQQLIQAPLTQFQFDALVSFTFNLGSGALQRSALRRRVNDEDHEAAAEEFLRWIYAGSKKLPGLIRRRQAESRLYQGFQPILQ